MLGQEGRSSSLISVLSRVLSSINSSSLRSLFVILTKHDELVLSDDIAEVAQLIAEVNAGLVDGFRSQHASLEKDLTYTVFHDSQDGVQHVWGPLLKQVNVVALILDSMRERAPSL